MTNPYFLTIDEFAEILVKSVKQGQGDLSLTHNWHPEDLGVQFELALNAITLALTEMNDRRKQ